MLFIRILNPLLLMLLLPIFSHFAATTSEKDGYTKLSEEEEQQLDNCRACMALTAVFMEEVMKPTEKLQHQLRQQQQQEGSAPRTPKNSDALRSGERQRLVTNVHDAIDKLCDRVKERNNQVDASYDKGKEERDEKSESTEGGPIWYVSVNTAACEVALEEVSEALAREAFAQLLPERVAGTRGGGPSAVCEQENLCTARLSQHVKSEEEKAKAELEKEMRRQRELSRKNPKETLALQRAVAVGVGIMVIALWLRGRQSAKPEGDVKKG
ncbi:hypothetical protein, conserved [Trypanosoma brucei gambiense DAL972]|uniref:T. brucei spp.-specific protein n=1 Tax=Trypanosoma brucei gambiense (strain MHOM/CI/86/DAL972) TaxID=679716 RepID=C9ZWW0_TRYB9|nr:hypothetical protein, conserved [Trypanosoma brucei gambiense DAL972]CBH13899.1 hypothetical protein, conserved [Trypanosoma brucei gambiense DAL972]|eukprot:XP_011776175.1 hypothetical protein, conserved [Trypanosoma brucei gambiense DAL972]